VYAPFASVSTTSRWKPPISWAMTRIPWSGVPFAVVTDPLTGQADSDSARREAREPVIGFIGGDAARQGDPSAALLGVGGDDGQLERFPEGVGHGAFDGTRLLERGIDVRGVEPEPYGDRHGLLAVGDIVIPFIDVAPVGRGEADQIIAVRQVAAESVVAQSVCARSTARDRITVHIGAMDLDPGEWVVATELGDATADTAATLTPARAVEHGIDPGNERIGDEDRGRAALIGRVVVVLVGIGAGDVSEVNIIGARGDEIEAVGASRIGGGFVDVSTVQSRELHGFFRVLSGSTR